MKWWICTTCMNWHRRAAQLCLRLHQPCRKMALLECRYLEKWSSASSRQTFRSLRFVVWKTEREVKSWGRPMSRKGGKERVRKRERESLAIIPLHRHNHSTLLISIAFPYFVWIIYVYSVHIYKRTPSLNVYHNILINILIKFGHLLMSKFLYIISSFLTDVLLH